MKYIPWFTLLVLATTSATAEEAPKKHNFYIDSFEYEDKVYSRSKKTELGDQVEIDVSVKYIYQPGTSLRLKFETSPEENRNDNESSKFELLLNHTQ